MGFETQENKKPLEIELLNSLIENNLYEEALSFITRLIDKYEDLNLLFLKAKIYYLEGKFDEAIEQLTTIIEKDSDYWEAYELLGEIYRLMNSNDIADNYYFKATTLNPRAIQSWLGKGKIALQKGEYQVAVLSFETYLRIKSDDVDVWRLLGRSYKELENYLSAIDAYNEAIEIEPTNQELYEELGDLYQFIGRSDIAKEKYMQAMQVEVKTRSVNRNLYTKLARIHLNENDNQKAFTICNELLALVRDDDEALFISGQALVKLGQRYDGIVRIKKAIEISDKMEYKQFLNRL